MPDETAVTVADATDASVLADADEIKSRYRLKRYAPGVQMGSVYAELRSLCLNGYTHVANMPGNFREIVYYARRFRLVVLDHRVNRMIADRASLTI